MVLSLPKRDTSVELYMLFPDAHLHPGSEENTMGPRKLAAQLLVAGVACLPAVSWAVLATVTGDAYTITTSPIGNFGTSTLDQGPIDRPCQRADTRAV